MILALDLVTTGSRFRARDEKYKIRETSIALAAGKLSDRAVLVQQPPYMRTTRSGFIVEKGAVRCQLYQDITLKDVFKVSLQPALVPIQRTLGNRTTVVSWQYNVRLFTNVES